MGKKKNDVGFLTAVALAGIFVVAAIMFTLTQYKIDLAITQMDLKGFTIAFGMDNSNGKLYFGLIFLFSVLAAAASCLAALKIIKIKANKLFMVSAVLALGSIIVYLVFYFKTTGRLKNNNVGGIDISHLIKWTFAFWCGFVLNVVALAGSAFGILKGK